MGCHVVSALGRRRPALVQQLAVHHLRRLLWAAHQVDRRQRGAHVAADSHAAAEPHVRCPRLWSRMPHSDAMAVRARAPTPHSAPHVHPHSCSLLLASLPTHLAGQRTWAASSYTLPEHDLPARSLDLARSPALRYTACNNNIRAVAHAAERWCMIGARAMGAGTHTTAQRTAHAWRTHASMPCTSMHKPPAQRHEHEHDHAPATHRLHSHTHACLSPWTRHRYKMLLKFADIDADGVISFRELMNFITSLPHQLHRSVRKICAAKTSKPDEGTQTAPGEPP